MTIIIVIYTSSSLWNPLFFSFSYHALFLPPPPPLPSSFSLHPPTRLTGLFPLNIQCLNSRLTRNCHGGVSATASRDKCGKLCCQEKWPLYSGRTWEQKTANKRLPVTAFNLYNTWWTQRGGDSFVKPRRRTLLKRAGNKAPAAIL